MGNKYRKTCEIYKKEKKHDVVNRPDPINKVTNRRMMFNWHDKELEPVKELDTVHTGDTHVQEDSEQDGCGHQAEKRSHKYRQAKQYRDHKGGEALISHTNNLKVISTSIL